MKFLVLFAVTAASAVTVYRSDDSMAMETRVKQQATETPEDQQKAAYTVYPKQERVKSHQDDQQRASYTVYPKQERIKSNPEDLQRYPGYSKSERVKSTPDDQQRYTVYPKQERVKEESYYPKQERTKTRPKKFSTTEENPNQYFENIHEEANNGHKMGFSSFVHHHDEADVTGQGSSDIKKTVPKSSVLIEMYHGPEQATKKPIQLKESGLTKLKNKPKIYQDTLNSYKKAKNYFPGSSNSSPILVKDLTTTPSTPAYFASTQPKFQPTFPKRRPYNKRQESDTQFQAAEASSIKTDSNPTSHSEANSLSGHTKFKYSKPTQPIDHSNIFHHIHAQTESPLLEIRGPRWTALSDSVEIASSEEVKPKRSRRPKEIHTGLTATHGHLFNTDQTPHFDHEKALRSSTAFGVSNVMFGSDLPETVKETTLEGGSAFNIVHSYDIAKAVEAQTIGAAKGPVQFGSEIGASKIPKHNMVNAGSFEIPVMTEEEFERHFGKYRQEGKKQTYRPVHRVPFDARPKQISQPKQPALSFSQFNGNVWAQSQNVPVVKHNTNVDMFPSYLMANRRNVSLVPERVGRVLSEDSNEPQQFSVSASYQIDRNHKGF